MRTDLHIGVFDVFIFLGVFQGLFLSWFFIKNVNNNNKANLYQGLLLLSLAMVIFEEWLNNTGYIVKALSLTNFSEPFSFAFGPLLYIYIRISLNPDEKNKHWWHFIFPTLWLLYMVFQFIQPGVVKYNDYVHTKHPDWGYLEEGVLKISSDPLGFRHYTNQILALNFIIYVPATIIVLMKKARSYEQSLFKTENQLLIILRNTIVHFLIIIVIFVLTKLYYGIETDIGSYFIAAYISFMIYATSYQVLNKSDFFNQPGSFLSFPMMKYQKSSLSEENKEVILTKIKKEMEGNNYFTNNLASLSGLAKQINESSHHVSQVINEKLNKNFFELLASYRVEHAKKLIQKDKESKLTVEELAELVGYNSKSSFNSAFKTITSKTPSEYRKSLSIM
ncbi:MAG: AraC family transcriptional regulator [Bacteroidetes bacterium]|nr:MAG: AraC family transcriptional regulator [Bacteroidota bacterium]